MNLPDGTPVTWFYRLAHRQAPRGPVRGPSLMKATLDRTTLRHFLLGGTEVILADLEGAIATSYPKRSGRRVVRTAVPRADVGGPR